MDNRIMRLIIALGKFSAQPRQYRIMEGLNASGRLCLADIY